LGDIRIAPLFAFSGPGEGSISASYFERLLDRRLAIPQLSYQFLAAVVVVLLCFTKQLAQPIEYF
jgi:hypothetical protein